VCLLLLLPLLLLLLPLLLLSRFWDCCGAADEAAPGCVQGYHLSFDDELNSSNGWRE
jgi:hypothetical protein